MEIGLGYPSSRAQDVRGALTFVERGEAEAGIVYPKNSFLDSLFFASFRLDPA